MNYSSIVYNDNKTGFGIRTTLSVCGCCNDCAHCSNPFAKDPDYGKHFTDDDLTDIVKSLDDKFVNGLVITGGDPLYPGNRQKICSIARTIKAIFGKEKSILMYTGYSLQEIKSWDDPDVDELLNYVDVIFEGRDSHSPKRKRCFEVYHEKTENTFRELYMRDI